MNISKEIPESSFNPSSLPPSTSSFSKMLYPMANTENLIQSKNLIPLGSNDILKSKVNMMCRQLERDADKIEYLGKMAKVDEAILKIKQLSMATTPALQGLKNVVSRLDENSISHEGRESPLSQDVETRCLPSGTIMEEDPNESYNRLCGIVKNLITDATVALDYPQSVTREVSYDIDTGDIIPRPLNASLSSSWTEKGIATNLRLSTSEKCLYKRPQASEALTESSKYTVKCYPEVIPPSFQCDSPATIVDFEGIQNTPGLYQSDDLEDLAVRKHNGALLSACIILQCLFMLPLWYYQFFNRDYLWIVCILVQIMFYIFSQFHDSYLPSNLEYHSISPNSDGRDVENRPGGSRSGSRESGYYST